MTASATVSTRVICVMTFRPSSPSLCSSSSFGMAIVSSCTMMEEVMYGEMLSANTDIFVKEPPVIVLKKLKAVEVWISHQALMYATLTPGVVI